VYIRDTRVKRGPEINSDHMLLIAEKVMEVDNRTQSYNNKNRKTSRDEDREERIKAYKLKEKNQQRKFQEKIEEELAKAGEEEQEQELEGLWELWKNTILTAAKQVCGTFRPGGTKKATQW
jgi:hypothetical protein